MRRLTCLWFFTTVLTLTCGVPLAIAQDTDNQDLHPNAHFGPKAAPAAAPTAADDKSEKAPPTMAYAAAVLSAIVVLSVICVPTRKSESMTTR